MTQRNYPFRCEVYGPGPNDFRLVLKSIATRDEIGRYHTVVDLLPSRPTSDIVLDVVPLQKTGSLGRVWNGMKEELDGKLDTFRPIISGFTIPNTLQADSPLPGQRTLERQRPLEPEPVHPSLSMGRIFGQVADSLQQWTRDYRSRLSGAYDADPRDGERIDTRPLFDALNEFESELETRDPHRIVAAADALKAAAANATRQTARTGDRPVKFVDNGGTPLPQGGVAQVIREFRGRTTDSRPRGSMQQANEASRRARAEERRQVEADYPWGPDAA